MKKKGEQVCRLRAKKNILNNAFEGLLPKLMMTQY